MKRSVDSNITVIVPTLNEEEGIGPTLDELKCVLGEPFILVPDGHSVDGTVKIAKSLGAETIVQNGRGKGQAIAQALDYLFDIGCVSRYIVFIDGDYTYPAEYIPEMIKNIEEDQNIGMVIGNRFVRDFEFKRAMRSTFYLGNRLIAFVQYLLNGVKLTDPLSGLRVVRSDLLKNWRPNSESFDVEAEMNFYVEKMGYRIREIPIEYRQRLGEKKLRLRHGFVIAKRIISEGLSSS